MSQKKKPSLNLSQKEYWRDYKLFFKPCKTIQEFDAWLKYFIDIDLPDHTISRYATTNPLEASWKIYDICVNNNNPDNLQDLIYCASRGSGKTLGMAIVEFMVMIHDKRSVCHIGAILQQAKRCFEYQQGFYSATKIKKILHPPKGLIHPVTKKTMTDVIVRETMEKSVFNIQDTMVSIEVLPLTLKAVNGPHVPMAIVDEIDTVSGEQARAYKEISGILDSRSGKKPIRIGISTRKSRYGLMNKQIEEAEHTGKKVEYWTALEFTERCTDERSGTELVDAYVIQDNLEAITQEEFDKKERAKQKDYVHYKLYKGCFKCPLATLCLGDLKKQHSQSKMLKTIDELAQKVRSEGADWALSQLMNLKPSVEGIVFREFEEKVHVKDWNQMWKTLTGTEFPGECTHDIFVKKCFSDDTEVLTKNGFKLFKDLSQYDEVASLDKKGSLIYERPTDYISYHYKGNAYNLYNKIGGHGKQLDLLMTEDHNQVYVEAHDLHDNKVKYKKDKIQNLTNKKFYIPAVPLSATHGKGYSPISYMTPRQYASFMGLWLSEGSCTSAKCNKEHRHNGISVSQLKAHNVKLIDDLFNEIEWPSSVHRKIDGRDGSINWCLYNKELYEHVRRWRYAVNKSIDRSFFDNASEQQMHLMLKWLLIGDGSEYIDDAKQQPYYGTGSLKLANDVQELAFRLGYRTNLSHKYNKKVSFRKDGTKHLDMYRVHIHAKGNNKGKKYWYINNGKSKSEFSSNKSNNIDKQTYDGMVYCVTMPSGQLFVRRNGVVALSGNCHEMQLPCYGGIDWGFSSPNTVVYFFVDKRENIYIVRCDGMTHVSQPMWIHYIKTKYHTKYRCQLYAPDQADQGAILEMQKAGLPVANNAEKGAINAGIQVIKKFLRVPATTEAKLFMAKETCEPIINEFVMYHYKLDAAGEVTEDPDGEHDHWLDALRYPLTLLFGKNTIVLGGGLQDEDGVSVMNASGSFNRTPTATEFADSMGIRINANEQDLSKLGKIGTKSELDDDDSDDGSGDGSGGFVWSM